MTKTLHTHSQEINTYILQVSQELTTRMTRNEFTNDHFAGQNARRLARS
uniref:Uncharacterized protein n=1 Tax=Arundo donax TaxID=35708 RepID=A0A0A8XU07_ARUDO